MDIDTSTNLFNKSWKIKQHWEFSIASENIECHPYILFFNGEEMPKWSNIWPEVPIESEVEPCLKQVLYKIDNENLLLSESAPVFIIAAQCVLIALIEHKNEYIDAFGVFDDPSLYIYNNLIAGLIKMIKIAETENVVFWASGNSSIKNEIIKVIEQYRKMVSHNIVVNPPHTNANNIKLVSTINNQRKRLRKLSNQKMLEKQHRELVNKFNDIDVVEFNC